MRDFTQTFFTRATKDFDVVTSILEKARVPMPIRSFTDKRAHTHPRPCLQGSAEVQHNDEQFNIDYYQCVSLTVSGPHTHTLAFAP